MKSSIRAILVVLSVFVFACGSDVGLSYDPAPDTPIEEASIPAPPPECPTPTGWCAYDIAGVPHGTCHGSTCCTGCWTEFGCLPGNTKNACGDNGESCSKCGFLQSCIDGECTIGTTSGCPTLTGACSVGSAEGTCYGTTCCTGCWTPASCLPGTSSGHCGNGGDVCQACGPAEACLNGSCVATD